MPQFPLQLVVFPRENLNLHIFEPRYKQLIGECEREGTTFGIPAFLDGEVAEVGTEVELLKIEKRYPNGELDIKTRGIGLFRIKEFLKQAPGKLYAGAITEPLSWEEGEADVLKRAQIYSLIKKLFAMMGVARNLPPEDFRTFDIGHRVGLTLRQEYELLQIGAEVQRQDYILDHLEKMLPRVEEMENIRRKIQMNGHFRNLKPPDF